MNKRFLFLFLPDSGKLKAAELMGRLHARLEEIGYTGHALEQYLVRLREPCCRRSAQ